MNNDITIEHITEAIGKKYITKTRQSSWYNLYGERLSNVNNNPCKHLTAYIAPSIIGGFYFGTI